jgi:hypothetical protein
MKSIKQNYRLPLIIPNPSLPRRRESSNFKWFWIPAFAGMTFLEEPYRLFSIKMPSFSLRYVRSLAKNKIKEYFSFICHHKEPRMEFKNPS